MPLRLRSLSAPAADRPVAQEGVCSRDTVLLRNVLESLVLSKVLCLVSR